MNKAQAISNFWESFGWRAYDESSVPEYIYDDGGNKVKNEPPYITYEVQMDSLGGVLMLSASLWDRSYSWKNISLKAAEIEKALKKNGYYSKKIDGGYVWINAGSPFATRLNTESDSIRRITLNITAEFLTAY